jgi:hypothetical protein
MKRSGRQFDKLEESDRSAVKKIVDALGNLTLGLDCAGAFIFQTRRLFSKYVELLDSSYGVLDEAKTIRARVASATLAWKINIEAIEQDDPDALTAVHSLDSDSICIHMMKEVFDQAVSDVLSEKFDIEVALKRLRRFSLINRLDSSNAISIPRLVQSHIKQHFITSLSEGWKILVIESIGD